MAKIKKVKPIPPKIKKIEKSKPSTDESESDLEETLAQEELEAFKETITSSSHISNPGGLRTGELRQQQVSQRTESNNQRESKEKSSERFYESSSSETRQSSTYQSMEQLQARGTLANPTIESNPQIFRSPQNQSQTFFRDRELENLQKNRDEKYEQKIESEDLRAKRRRLG